MMMMIVTLLCMNVTVYRSQLTARRPLLLLASMGKVSWAWALPPIHSLQNPHIIRRLYLPYRLYHRIQVKVLEEVILLVWVVTVVTDSEFFFVIAARAEQRWPCIF